MSPLDKAPGAQPWEAMARSARLGQLVGPAMASAYANAEPGPLAMRNLTRCVASAEVGGEAGNVTVSATSLAVLPTYPLSLEVVLSGRPLTVTLTGVMQAGASGNLVLDVNLRGVAVSGAANGLIYTSLTSPLSLTGTARVTSPVSGPATLEVVAKRATADGTVYTDANNRLLLLVTEE